MIRYRMMGWGILFVVIALFQASTVPAGPHKDLTVEQAYPGLATGILKSAKLVKLKKGVLLTAGEVQIKEALVKNLVKNAKPEIQEQLEKNLFFILEQQVIQKILLHEAYKNGHKKSDPEDQVIMAYLSEKASRVTVTDEEAKAFYDQNKEMVGGMPYEQVKDAVKGYLLQKKKQEAVASYVQILGKGIYTRIDSKWVKKQSILARDNPVDRARSSGKSTLVEFGATGCKPCDMMQPILANLRKKYSDSLNVLFVHVGQEQILGARHGITSIPVQVFFDRAGKETFRHVGFYPQKEIESKLVAMGVK